MEEHSASLSEFLVIAKKSTYSSKSAKEKGNQDGSKEFSFKKGKLAYSDKYYGTHSFSGQETVFSGKTPLWSMVYTGRSLVSGSEEKKMAEFLKNCLSKVERDAPFRGPLKFKMGKFSYENTFFGNLSMFSGSEAIMKSGKVVFVLSYSGGAVE